ncbi:hypothetical protein HOD30_04975 [Candidatus Peregrinibacteria bacterium]|jgi:hypothetical protein|nr:hypothetical protein [Candidatus Peregrinibacteria bacterium]MBT4631377.1 hypothetical protein [Candidatus Peregrinibacteria bacterium]MBT5517166.1 hypothetical protein [Candidatus Peregrinibacteria bacterium]MBT5823748.1 hypothetical protein [Candidatus Peregrinibacteria bacterium]
MKKWHNNHNLIIALIVVFSLTTIGSAFVSGMLIGQQNGMQRQARAQGKIVNEFVRRVGTEVSIPADVHLAEQILKPMNLGRGKHKYSTFGEVESIEIRDDGIFVFEISVSSGLTSLVAANFETDVKGRDAVTDIEPGDIIVGIGETHDEGLFAKYLKVSPKEPIHTQELLEL